MRTFLARCPTVPDNSTHIERSPGWRWRWSLWAPGYVQTHVEVELRHTQPVNWAAKRRFCMGARKTPDYRLEVLSKADWLALPERQCCVVWYWACQGDYVFLLCIMKLNCTAPFVYIVRNGAPPVAHMEIQLAHHSSLRLCSTCASGSYVIMLFP